MSKSEEISIKNLLTFNFIRFFIIGLATSFCVIFLGYIINFTSLIQSFALINFISGCFGILISFSLNYRFNFFDRNKRPKVNFFRFVLVSTSLMLAVIPMTSMAHLILEDLLLGFMSEDLMRITLHVLVLKMFFIISFLMHNYVTFGASNGL